MDRFVRDIIQVLNKRSLHEGESARWVKLAAQLDTRKCIIYSDTAMFIFHGRWIAERKRIRERRKAEIGRKLKGGEQGIGDVVERRGRYCLPRVLERETE